MAYSGSTGQYGAIPANIFRTKYEVTDMEENLDQLDYHMRDSLRDVGCSSTFFESDHKREDTHSEEILSLRHEGHRSGERPDAPDLFLEMTDREVRGTAVDPNFRALRDMSWARRDTHKFYSDSDHSVPERDKRPQVLIQQIRDQFENLKQRLKIFATSREYINSRSTYTTGTTSNVELVDLQNADAPEVEIDPRARVAQAEQIGWEQTSDHEYKVASYGLMRPAAVGGDTGTNRGNQQDTARLAQSREMDKRMLMKAAVLAKREAQVEMLHTTRDTHSKHRAGKKTVSAVVFAGDQNHAASVKTQERFIGQLQRQSGMPGQDIESQLQRVTFMENSTRVGNMDAKYSRDVQQTLRVSAFCDRTNMQRNTDTLRQHDSYVLLPNHSVQVAQLGGAKMTRGGVHLSTGTRLPTSSAQSAQTTVRAPEARNAYRDTATQQHDTFTTLDRATRGVGDKYTREKMDTTVNRNAVNDQ